MIELDKQKRISFDLDGTLTDIAGFPNIWTTTPEQLSKTYEDIEPRKDIIAMMNKLYDKGYIIFIFTSRSNMYQSVTKKWLKKHNAKYHYLVVDKPYYDLLVDDKAIDPNDLKNKMKELLSNRK